MTCIMCRDDGFGKAKDSVSASKNYLCLNHGSAYMEHRLEIAQGDKCCRQGRCSYAVPYYDRALCIFPRSTEALHMKSKALIQLTKYNEAIICLDDWLEIEPNSATAYANKGIALCLLGRHDDAVQCFEMGKLAITLVTNAYFCYVCALYMIGLYQEAWANCVKMLRCTPHDKNARLLKKRCQNALGLKPRWMFWHRR